jgi:drug/metabolite transporter (DMT)-like permease
MHHLFLYFLLVASLLLASASASLYRALDPIPGSMKATWRLQLTALAQLLPYLYTWSSKPIECLENTRRYLPIQMLSGFMMSGNFILFTLSLEHTSVAHSVLFINTCPVIIVSGTFIYTRKVKSSDLVGALMGLLGLVLISQDMQSQNSSLLGDSYAIAGALCMSFHLLLGQYVLGSSSISVWTYLFPITVMSSMISWIFSIFGYNCTLSNYLEWKDERFLPYVLLGILPGFICNSSYIYLVKHLRPVIVTSFINFSPVISSFIAWFCGFQEIPKLYTWLGGLILISGNMVITLSKDDKRSLESLESVLQQSLPKYQESSHCLPFIPDDIEELEESKTSLN